MMNLTPYFRTLLAGMMITSGGQALVFAGPGMQSKPFTFVQMCDTQLGMGR